MFLIFLPTGRVLSLHEIEEAVEASDILTEDFEYIQTEVQDRCNELVTEDIEKIEFYNKFVYLKTLY